MCAHVCVRAHTVLLISSEKLQVQFIEKFRLLNFFKHLFNGGVVSTLVCFTVLSHLIGSWDPLPLVF